MGKTVAIILAGGEGKRVGGGLPKQFLPLKGKPLIAHSIETFDNSNLIDEIIIVSHEKHIGRIIDLVDVIKPNKKCKIIPGGKTRQESSYEGVKSCSPETSYVLLHDAARPFVTDSIIENVTLAAESIGASGPVIDMEDTVILEKDGFIKEIPPKSSLRRIQTPQAFRYEVILEAHKTAKEEGISNYSDDCGMVLGINRKVKLVEGSKNNIKVTSQSDFTIAENL